MSKYNYDKDYLLDKSNKGLDVFLALYPEAAKKGGKYPHFTLQFESDKTPSSLIYDNQNNDHLAIIKSYSSGESFNCFELVMRQFNLSFYESCQYIAELLNLCPLNPVYKKSTLEIIPFDAKDEKPGDVIFDETKITQDHLEVLGPLVTKELIEASPFNVKALKSFSRVKKYSTDLKEHNSKHTHKYAGETCLVVTKASEDYPIFMFDFGDWQKIYQPYNSNKKFRFQYAGKKPSNYFFGLEYLRAKYKKFDQPTKEELEDGAKPLKFDNIIIGSGERDCINLASLGYHVLWNNSETADFPDWLIAELHKMAENVYACFDLDDTGIEKVTELGLKYIDVRLIFLPDELKNKTSRGKARKDVTDYCMVNYNAKNPEGLKYDFKKIVDTSLPCRFWDWLPKAKRYDFNNKAAIQFLKLNGFYKYNNENSKEDYEFVRLDKNVIKRVNNTDLENFPSEWLDSKMYPIPLQNFIIKTAQINDKRLKKLPTFTPKIQYATPNYQRFFFKNKAVQIDKEKIELVDYKKLETQVWEENIIDKDIQLKECPFKISQDENGTWDIEILHTKNKFFNYLINSSRIHWRKFGYKPYFAKIANLKKQNLTRKKEVNAITKIKKEARKYQKDNQFKIAEKGLTDAEIYDQKLALINKIFSFGFICHSYKVYSKAWFVFAMDNEIAEADTSNGGTGKSFGFNLGLSKVFGDSHVVINAADKELVKSQFLYDGITPNTRTVIFDDASRYFPFRKVYNNITGSWHVNPKYDKAYSLPYEKSPKVVFTSNFGMIDMDPSTERRILFCPFSDYYHADSKNELYEWKISEDAGGDLFSDQTFDQEQWNHFYSFIFYATSFQLGQEKKIQPPLENVEKRNAKESVGTAFEGWAESYFTLDNLNTYIVKEDAMKDFEKDSGMRNMSSAKFKQKLESYCDLKGWEFNPPHKLNSTPSKKTGLNTRYVQTMYRENKGKQVSTEMIWVNVPEETVEHLKEVEDVKADQEGFDYGGDQDFDPTENIK